MAIRLIQIGKRYKKWYEKKRENIFVEWNVKLIYKWNLNINMRIIFKNIKKNIIDIKNLMKTLLGILLYQKQNNLF